MLLAAASVVAHMYVQSQVYHPVVRLEFNDGLSLTAVLTETKERKACGATNDRFLTPFKQCKECRIRMARCERTLEGVEQALREGAPLPYPTVVARDARVALMGPPALAQAGCEATAAAMVAKGFRSATCIPAHPRPAKS